LAEQRLWQVDFLRGLAVCMMLISNFLFDLFYFSALFDPQAGFPALLARSTAGLFVLLVGISLTLSYARSDSRQRGFLKYFRRGVTIFSMGMLITAATRIAVGQQYVVFGILHLIGLGIILAYPFLRHRIISLCCGLLVIFASFVTSQIMVSCHWLLWLGLQYKGFTSVDYTPLIPWFGLILVGIFLGPYFMTGGWMHRHTALAGRWWLVRKLAVCGKHSLLIYFVHQPLFWAGFWLWSVVIAP